MEKKTQNHVSLKMLGFCCELVHEPHKRIGYEIHTRKSVISGHTCKENFKVKAITFTTASRGIKYLDMENLDSVNLNRDLWYVHRLLDNTLEAKLSEQGYDFSAAQDQILRDAV
jgi:hypothetical protein